MSSAKLAALSGLAALALSACGASTTTPNRGRIDDPRTSQSNHVKCMLKAHLPVVKVGRTDLQVGALPAGPTVHFAPTPGLAQGLQINGQVQGAEVIGSALLYPNQASDNELSKIETCLAQGVKG
jgi:hypothetical protein